MNQKITLALAFFLLAELCTAFSVGIHQCESKRQMTPVSMAGTVLEDATALDYLTPQQVAALRKECRSRKAKSTLATVSFRSCTTEEEQEAMLNELAQLLRKEELVEVRGISIDDRKFVYETATEIAEIIGNVQTTFMVDIKGHAVIYYCPNGSFPLRTTTKQNAWTKRAKKERDISGKIIK